MEKDLFVYRTVQKSKIVRVITELINAIKFKQTLVQNISSTCIISLPLLNE